VVRQGHGEKIDKETKNLFTAFTAKGFFFNKHSLWKSIKNCPLKPKEDDAQGRKRIQTLCSKHTNRLTSEQRFQENTVLYEQDSVRFMIMIVLSVPKNSGKYTRKGGTTTKQLLQHCDYIQKPMCEH